MKRIITSAIAFAILTGSFSIASAQTKPRTEKPHKVGLIDMAYVFQEYEEFKMLREDLKSEIERSDVQARKYMDQSKSLQGQLKTFKSGSNEAIQTEQKLVDLKAAFEAYRTKTQRDLMRKESQIYKQVYVKVSAVVEQYCSYYNYTLVMRFSRKSVGDSDAPGDIVNGMNRQVVFFQTEDDITDKVLKVLNQRYREKSGSNRSAGRTAPVSATRNK